MSALAVLFGPLASAAKKVLQLTDWVSRIDTWSLHSSSAPNWLGEFLRLTVPDLPLIGYVISVGFVNLLYFGGPRKSPEISPRQASEPPPPQASKAETRAAEEPLRQMHEAKSKLTMSADPPRISTAPTAPNVLDVPSSSSPKRLVPARATGIPAPRLTILPSEVDTATPKKSGGGESGKYVYDTLEEAAAAAEEFTLKGAPADWAPDPVFEFQATTVYPILPLEEHAPKQITPDPMPFLYVGRPITRIMPGDSETLGIRLGNPRPSVNRWRVITVPFRNDATERHPNVRDARDVTATICYAAFDDRWTAHWLGSDKPTVSFPVGLVEHELVVLLASEHEVCLLKDQRAQDGPLFNQTIWTSRDGSRIMDMRIILAESGTLLTSLECRIRLTRKFTFIERIQWTGQQTEAVIIGITPNLPKGQR
ncbi:MAG: hypothetical protein AABO58_25515 [Acidobacteriota bacterium]